ncbi:expressed unknown protein [Ectocarpus siliculosus]|uniref:Uncharacterized protein n=1 Tax=Ectocarpus siliculosus TaxID=2880 RepID=D7G1K1_ECTSI|nr:expressed unknown protein [Ectocarpus siliculosus]|eukprot:CBJ26809.1 expressed unknown protein [Ectocarpus siliculosus]
MKMMTMPTTTPLVVLSGVEAKKHWWTGTSSPRLLEGGRLWSDPAPRTLEELQNDLLLQLAMVLKIEDWERCASHASPGYYPTEEKKTLQLGTSRVSQGASPNICKPSFVNSKPVCITTTLASKILRISENGCTECQDGIHPSRQTQFWGCPARSISDGAEECMETH